MKIRTPVVNEFGTIDCEIEHPRYGWIPFTADPNDAEPLGAAVFKAAQGIAVPYSVPATTASDFDDAALRAKQGRIAELRRLLAGTDYVVLADYDRDRPDVLAQRQAWRDEIRELGA